MGEGDGRASRSLGIASRPAGKRIASRSSAVSVRSQFALPKFIGTGNWDTPMRKAKASLSIAHQIQHTMFGITGDCLFLEYEACPPLFRTKQSMNMCYAMLVREGSQTWS